MSDLPTRVRAAARSPSPDRLLVGLRRATESLRLVLLAVLFTYTLREPKLDVGYRTVMLVLIATFAQDAIARVSRVWRRS